MELVCESDREPVIVVSRASDESQGISPEKTDKDGRSSESGARHPGGGSGEPQPGR